ELVHWAGLIAAHQPLPGAAAPAAVPEFDVLTSALRDMATALERARAQELENERLTALRETARHVAHEMRGPLSAARLALNQVAAPDRAATALKVLEDETSRLDRLAREFAEFGRLPEGPRAQVDVGELLTGVIAATVPAERRVSR